VFGDVGRFDHNSFAIRVDEIQGKVLVVRTSRLSKDGGRGSEPEKKEQQKSVKTMLTNGEVVRDEAETDRDALKHCNADISRHLSSGTS